MTSRTVAAATLAALEGHTHRLAALYEAAFDSGTVRLWSGWGDLTIGTEAFINQLLDDDDADLLDDDGATLLDDDGSIDITSSKTYTGTGDLVSVSKIEETQEIRASSVTLSLAGASGDHIAEALAEPVLDRVVRVELIELTEDNQVIGDPVPLFIGRADAPRLKDDGRDASYTITVESRLIDLKRTRLSRYTDDDQQRRFPGDRGLEHVTTLQDLDIPWGRG